MKFIVSTFLLLIFITQLSSQQSQNISFNHDGKVVYGTFTKPHSSGKFPTIIIAPGSGANDRHGTIPMTGANVACLYPNLLNDTLFPYKGLSDALVDSGYAVLRYDKLEYTYPTNLGSITFHKLWLPVESAIDYVKSRTDVDTNQIVLMGHSEGSSLIPYIAKSRNDIKALVSIAGPRTPFDSILAYQIVNIAQTCGGNVSQAQMQANQILAYFNSIRTNTWNSSTPPLFGVPASVWYDYILATDSVAINYNIANLPTLFTGMALDINVPPSELTRFQNDVSITNDFWTLPGLNHYMTPNNIPHVSETLSDTIVYWLRQNNIIAGIKSFDHSDFSIKTYPNPFSETFTVESNDNSFKNTRLRLSNGTGQVVHERENINFEKGFSLTVDLAGMPKGVYVFELISEDQKLVKKLIKNSNK